MSFLDLSKLFVRHYEKRDGSIIDINQSECGDVGCVVWDAALVLSAYIETEHFRSNFRNKCAESFLSDCDIIELGAGTGIVGILCGTYGARCILTDLPEFIPLIELNIKVNSNLINGHVISKALTWGQAEDDILPKPNFILVSDCIYYSASIEPLVTTLKNLCDNSTIILFCYEKRTSDEKLKLEQAFFELVGKHFSYLPVPFEVQDARFRSEDIIILQMRKHIS